MKEINEMNGYDFPIATRTLVDGVEYVGWRSYNHATHASELMRCCIYVSKRGCKYECLPGRFRARRIRNDESVMTNPSSIR